MNYRGTWICAGNYSRILLVGDIWVNTICPSVQRECKDPIDVVYSNEGAEMLYKLICQQMLHTHYGMIILCENAYDTVATATLTERLMGMFARSTIVLATAPPEWLKSIKYKGTETTKERNNTQCRKIAEQYQLPCLDFAEWAERDGLQTQESASYPARFLTKLELKRLHFNKIKKIKKIDAREGGRQELTLRYMAIKMAMFINKIRQDKAKESVLWDNFQYEPECPYLLLGDSNMRRIRSMNKALRAQSDIFTCSSNILAEGRLKEVLSMVKPHHKAILFSLGTHHLSDNYSGYFEERLRTIFSALQKMGKKLVLINLPARATERRPYVQNVTENKLIQSLNKRMEAVAAEFNLPCINMYQLMQHATFEDSVHYTYDAYTEVSTLALKLLQSEQ